MENKILELRNRYNLTRADIEKKYDIPQRTLYNWETGLRKCPDYVVNLLERTMTYDYEKSEALQRIEKFFEGRKNPERDMDTALRLMKYLEYLAKGDD